MIAALFLVALVAFVVGIVVGIVGLVRYVATADDQTYRWFTEELSYQRRRLQGRDR